MSLKWLTLLANNPTNAPGGKPLGFFTFDGANPDNIDHVRTTVSSGGAHKFFWERSAGAASGDFDGVVFRVSRTSSRAFQVPGRLGESVRTTFTWTFREADFNNELGLFRVDDPTGRIGSLHPGDRGYAAAPFPAPHAA